MPILPSPVHTPQVNIFAPTIAEGGLLNPAENAQVTIGDLHGNSMKLLDFLRRSGVVNVAGGEYSTLVDIYKKNVEDLTREDLTRFRGIIDRLLLQRKDLLIRLIGDVLADRGANDYFTLYILDHLFKNGVKVEAIFSNHDDGAFREF